jgi:hypothetical protein
MSDDTEWSNPFVSDTRDEEKIVVGSANGQANFAIHATKDQWAALALYCLQCVEALVLDEAK